MTQPFFFLTKKVLGTGSIASVSTFTSQPPKTQNMFLFYPEKGKVCISLDLDTKSRKRKKQFELFYSTVDNCSTLSISLCILIVVNHNSDNVIRPHFGNAKF